MKIDSLTMKKEDFDRICNDDNNFTPESEFERHYSTNSNVKFLVVKDEITGQKAVFSQSQSNANAQFVAKIKKRPSANSVDKNESIYDIFYKPRGEGEIYFSAKNLNDDDKKFLDDISKFVNTNENRVLYSSLNTNKVTIQKGEEKMENKEKENGSNVDNKQGITQQNPNAENEKAKEEKSEEKKSEKQPIVSDEQKKEETKAEQNPVDEKPTDTDGIVTDEEKVAPENGTTADDGAENKEETEAEKWVKIEITHKRNLDTMEAYLVVGPHPNKKDDKSWYFLTSLQKDGKDIDLKDPKAIFAADGKAVYKKIEVDKNSEISFKIYDEKDKPGKKLGGKWWLFAEDSKVTIKEIHNIDLSKNQELVEVQSQENVDEKQGETSEGAVTKDDSKQVQKSKEADKKDKKKDNEKPELVKFAEDAGTPDKVKPVKLLLKVRRGVPFVVAGAVAAAGIGVGTWLIVSRVKTAKNDAAAAETTQYEAIINNAETQATTDGQTIASNSLANNTGDLLNYFTVNNTVDVQPGGNATTIIKAMSKDIQSSAEKYVTDNDIAEEYKNAVTVAYVSAATNAAFETFAVEGIVLELYKYNVSLLVRTDSTSEATVSYKFPAEASAVVTASTSEEHFTTFVASTFNLDDSNTAAAVESYKTGFKEKANEIANEHGDVIASETEQNKIDFSDSTTQDAILTSVKVASDSASTKDLKLAYVSTKDNVVFVKSTDGNYLYKMKLEGEITDKASLGDALKKVDADDVTEAVNLGALATKDLEGAYTNYRNEYISKSGMENPSLYVTMPNSNAKKVTGATLYSITLFAVEDDNSKIEESTTHDVRVKDGTTKSDRTIVFAAVVGHTGIDIPQEYSIISTTEQTTTSYESNELAEKSNSPEEVRNNKDNERSL